MIEIMKTALKNKRNYRKKIGRSTAKVDEEDEDNPEIENEIEGNPNIENESSPATPDVDDGNNGPGEVALAIDEVHGEGGDSNDSDEPEEEDDENGIEEDLGKKRKANSQAGGRGKRAKISA